MKRYIARHGQLIERHMLPPEEAAKFPPSEKPLSDLGRCQARLLGEKMLSLGFHGKIISSPYYRTLETSQIIADITGSTIIPFAPIRERLKEDEVTVVSEFRGFNLSEIKKLFRSIDTETQLDERWWCEPDGKAIEEPQERVDERVEAGYKLIDEKYRDEDILIVSHAAASHALFKYLKLGREAFEKIPDKRLFLRTAQFNCSLSVIDTEDDDFVPIYCDSSYIPYEKTTSNFTSREEWDMEFFLSEYTKEITIPEGFEKASGTKILHIGDTLSKHFPFFRKLIDTVKPDIILHTGDMVDEVKAGRIPSVAYEYRTKLKVMLDIMKASGARLMIVPGNNDLTDVIRELCPTAEIYASDTVVEFGGITCRIGHSPVNMHHDKVWSFYGHTLCYDDWNKDNNVKGGHCRFNCIKGPYVCTTGDGRFYRFETPEHI